MVVKKAEHCGIAGDTVGFTVFPGLRHIIVLRLRFHICLSQVDEKPALIASIRQSLAKINLNRIIKAAKRANRTVGKDVGRIRIYFHCDRCIAVKWNFAA